MIKPKNFVEGVSILDWDNKPEIKFEHQIYSASVRKSVIIDENGSIKKSNGCDPNQDLWFIVWCKNFYGAEFWVITDGEKWMPYDNKSNIIRKPKLPKSVDVDKLSDIDKERLQKIIYHFIYDGGKNVNPNAG